MKIFWKIAKWFVVIWIAFLILTLFITLWNDHKRSVYNRERLSVDFWAEIVFYDYTLKGSLPSKMDDIEELNDKRWERLIYRIIDVKSNIFSVSSKKIEEISMFFQINETTNEPTLTKIEGENLIQIREFYSNKEGLKKDKLKENSKKE